MVNGIEMITLHHMLFSVRTFSTRKPRNHLVSYMTGDYRLRRRSVQHVKHNLIKYVLNYHEINKDSLILNSNPDYNGIQFRYNPFAINSVSNKSVSYSIIVINNAS